MEKDLLNAVNIANTASVANADRPMVENSFGKFQKAAAFAPKLCYNESISQNDLDCELQAKEGVLV